MRDQIQNYVLEPLPPQSAQKFGKFGSLQDIVCNFLFTDQAAGNQNLDLNFHLNQALSQDFDLK